VKIAAVYVTKVSREVADFYVEAYDTGDDLPDYPWKKPNLGDRIRK